MSAYSPSDRWPQHPKAHYKTVFSEAQELGWSLDVYTNHNTYRLTCPTGGCVLGPIFTSARDGEAKAKEFLKEVRRCPHGAAKGLSLARQQLASAERLLDAAEILVKSHHMEALASRTLMDPEGFDESEVDELLTQVEELENELDDTLGVHEPAEALDSADTELSSARSTLAPLVQRKVAEAKALWELRKRLRQRCDELRKDTT